jgi:hypothetical protein
VKILSQFVYSGKYADFYPTCLSINRGLIPELLIFIILEVPNHAKPTTTILQNIWLHCNFSKKYSFNNEAWMVMILKLIFLEVVDEEEVDYVAINDLREWLLLFVICYPYSLIVNR